ncbi:MAG: endonuclease III domain-containing protein [Dehalococcoidales bacterium]
MIRNIYDKLLAAYGPQNWWPAETPFEVMIGAVLTQSTAWSNVEKAIGNLKNADALSLQAIKEMSFPELAELIRPSGYYNAKARKLKALIYWLDENYSGDILQMRKADTNRLREDLLAVYGVGPETADSILLYALEKPVFVVDSYTKRIFSRIGLIDEECGYNDCQRLFTANLAADAVLFNEYHALIVKLAKEACNKKPVCTDCCLLQICNYGKNPAAKAKKP